jgi:hypothetical protein
VYGVPPPGLKRPERETLTKCMELFPHAAAYLGGHVPVSWFADRRFPSCLSHSLGRENRERKGEKCTDVTLAYFKMPNYHLLGETGVKL